LDDYIPQKVDYTYLKIDRLKWRKLVMAKQKNWHGPADYQIKVNGNLGSQWSDWFEGMTIESENAVTTMTGKVLDQSALHGLLVRVRDLGLPLISVKRIENNQNKSIKTKEQERK
jgi:hypothetical protein